MMSIARRGGTTARGYRTGLATVLLFRMAVRGSRLAGRQIGLCRLISSMQAADSSRAQAGAAASCTGTLCSRRCNSRK